MSIVPGRPLVTKRNMPGHGTEQSVFQTNWRDSLIGLLFFYENKENIITYTHMSFENDFANIRKINGNKVMKGFLKNDKSTIHLPRQDFGYSYKWR